ncbi:Oxysterol-binding protein [Teratosphaeria nubilosa]|uniref:Oxysterol-binding protein n=1 Tax=Teratosphaeria nubilosa TaxID=161662 RepID=A0A6G1L8X9_9PEZI|nr:Oxysterol-binding protein [Teratosphaeria nubilosa]
MDTMIDNITAPPFVLADKSTTEFPRYWIEYPDLFCAPAHEKTPERRILAVLKWFLSSLRGQQCAGRDPGDGVKKPLNAFLGEVFTGECGAEGDECKLVSEQVSHHPPVTACYLWNENHGIRAEGYTRQEINFSGSINIQQIGHAILHIDEYDEDYLIPLPNVKVKGILTGGPYPELSGTYEIVSSSGFLAEIDFSGKSLLGFGGKKNHVVANVYPQDDATRKNAVLMAKGNWSESFTITDSSGQTLDTYNVASASASTFRVPEIEQQDPWESRKAWSGVINGIHRGNMQDVATKKSKLENAQRELRKLPETAEEKWRPLFFRKENQNAMAERLLAIVGKTLNPADTRGAWKFDGGKAASLERPWRKELTPYGGS